MNIMIMIIYYDIRKGHMVLDMDNLCYTNLTVEDGGSLL